MSDLCTLEQDFQGFVLDGVPGIEGAIVSTGRVPAAKRLAIYSDAYRARLTEALGNNYPVMAKLLGEDRFRALAGLYTQRHRSAHFSIRWYGGRLGELLRAESPYREQAGLAELADWEWSMTLAFDAVDVPPFRAEALAAVAPEQWAELTFRLHPSVRQLSLDTNAVAIWRAVNKDEPTPEFVHDVPRDWLIWRHGLDTFFRSLDAVEARALSAVARGDSFGDLCELLAQVMDGESAAIEAAKFLRRWLDDELLAAT